MERGEDEAIDSSDDQDLTDKRGHLRGAERKKLLHSEGGWQRIVCSYTPTATRASGCMYLCGRIRRRCFPRVNESGQLELLLLAVPVPVSVVCAFCFCFCFFAARTIYLSLSKGMDDRGR